MARTLKTKLINKDGRIHSSVFVILPDVKTVFAKRTQRFTHLANEMPNKECLLFSQTFAMHNNNQSKNLKILPYLLVVLGQLPPLLVLLPFF